MSSGEPVSSEDPFYKVFGPYFLITRTQNETGKQPDSEEGTTNGKNGNAGQSGLADQSQAQVA